MKRVLHILNTGVYSGAENVVITIINLTKDSFNSTYVSLDGPIRDYLKDSSITFFPIKKISISEMKRVINAVHPDIIHAHDFTAGIFCALSSNIPIINHLHNNPPWIKHYSVRSLVYALCSIKFKKILTVSSYVMDEYIFGHYLKEKTIVVGNPIDVNRIRKLGRNNEIRFDLAFLGRLSSQKNPLLFIEIVDKLRKKNFPIKAVMIGDGELRKSVESMIKECCLESCVELLGFQKNPYSFLSQSKILVMPSKWEGYGLAAVEALALGKPVVCSSAGGLPTIVTNNCGKLCKTIEDYTSSIEILLKDNKQYKAKSDEAIRRANMLSNLKSYCFNIEQIYNSLLNCNLGL